MALAQNRVILVSVKVDVRALRARPAIDRPTQAAIRPSHAGTTQMHCCQSKRITCGGGRYRDRSTLIISGRVVAGKSATYVRVIRCEIGFLSRGRISKILLNQGFKSYFAIVEKLKYRYNKQYTNDGDDGQHFHKRKALHPIFQFIHGRITFFWRFSAR
jgi:hypothetical protein